MTSHVPGAGTGGTDAGDRRDARDRGSGIHSLLPAFRVETNARLRGGLPQAHKQEHDAQTGTHRGRVPTNRRFSGQRERKPAETGPKRAERVPACSARGGAGCAPKAFAHTRITPQASGVGQRPAFRRRRFRYRPATGGPGTMQETLTYSLSVRYRT